MIGMTIEYLISMAEKRLAQIENARRISESNGNLDEVLFLDEQIQEMRETLRKLNAVASP